MVSYAKWDNFDVSDDEEETSNRPIVTKFDEEGGRSIHIGPSGSAILDPQVKPRVPSSSALSSPSTTVSVFDIKNGGRTAEYCWRQTREEVVIQFALALADLKSKDISIIYDDESKTLTIKAVSEVLLVKKLPFDIECNPSIDGESPVDWEVVRRTVQATQREERFIELTLRKKVPFNGLTIWWKSAFAGDEEIDVTKIQGRGESNKAIWEEAHSMFLEKIKNKQKIEVDVGNEE